MNAPAAVVIDRAGLDALIHVLMADGYRVVGPTVRDGAIVLAELDSPDQLPAGWGVDVAPGHYRLHPREDGAVFAHSAGPQSCKQFLHPARQRLWSSRPDGAYSADSGDAPRYAFVGVRGCDLAAIGILGTVLAGGAHSDSSELASLTERLRHALDDALATVRVVSSVQFPDVELDYDLLALHQDDRYAIDQGQLRSTGGFGFDVADFDDHVVEHQVVHSTALHVRLDGHRYLVGPLARYTLDSGQLSPTARQAAADAGLSGQCRNPFRSIVVRAVEVVYALDEALRLIEEYQPPPWPCVDVPPRAGIGQWAIEAPRRLLYHRYELDTDELIRAATIVPPTAQNQDAIEDDLRRLVSRNLHLDDAHLTALCEQGDPQLRPRASPAPRISCGCASSSDDLAMGRQ